MEQKSYVPNVKVEERSRMLLVLILTEIFDIFLNVTYHHFSHTYSSASEEQPFANLRPGVCTQESVKLS